MDERAYRNILRQLGVEVEPATEEKPTPEMECLLDLPLSEFARRGLALKVRVPRLSEPIWLVSGPAEAEALLKESVNRGLIWTAAEAADLLSVATLTLDEAKTVARFKLELGGEILGTPERNTK